MSPFTLLFPDSHCVLWQPAKARRKLSVLSVVQLQIHLKGKRSSRAHYGVCARARVDISFRKWLANDDYISFCLDLSGAKRLLVLCVPDGNRQTHSWHSCAQLMSSPPEPEPSGRQQDES